MAIAYRSQSSTAYGPPRNNTTLAAPAGLANDDIMFAMVGGGGPGVEISNVVPPAGWTQIGTKHYVTDFSWIDGVWLFWKRAASESGSYTFTVDGGNARDQHGVLVCYSGATNVGSPIDAFSIAVGSQGATSTDPGTGASTTATAPSITTTVANDMLVNIIRTWASNGGSIAPTSGFTERFDVAAQPAYIQDKIQAAIGATGTVASICNAAATSWVTYLIALKETGGAAAGIAAKKSTISQAVNRASYW